LNSYAHPGPIGSGPVVASMGTAGTHRPYPAHSRRAVDRQVLSD
jgi:hypothetical protein